MSVRDNESEIDGDRQPTNGRALNPPQFSLRLLFLFIGIVSVGITVLINQGLLVSIGLGLIFLVVLAHVAGNSIGTALRGNSLRKQANAVSREAIAASVVGPRSKLAQRKSLGLLPVIATAIGAILGGTIGIFALFYFYPTHVDVLTFVISLIASSALGAFWCFWCWSLTQVAMTAWWQADRKGKR